MTQKINAVGHVEMTRAQPPEGRGFRCVAYQFNDPLRTVEGQAVVKERCASGSIPGTWLYRFEIETMTADDVSGVWVIGAYGAAV